MRAITVAEAIPAEILGVPLEPGIPYLMADIASIAWKGSRNVYADWRRREAEAREQDDGERLERLADERPRAWGRLMLSRHISRDANPDLRPWKYPRGLDGKRLLFLNPQGLGDYLMLAPTLRKLKMMYPDLTVGMVCHASHAAFVANINHVDAVIADPLRSEELASWDYHVNYEWMWEKDPRANEVPAPWLFAERLGLELAEDGTAAEYDPGGPEMPEWFGRVWPDGKPEGQKWIGIFLKASARCRDWPPDRIVHLTHGLCFAGYSVFWLGRAGDSFAVAYHPQGPEGNYYAGDMRGPEGFLDLAGKFADPVQLAAFCRDWIDLIVSPDSFGVHLGGALGKPTIGLFGPIPPRLRSEHYRSVVNLHGKVPCAPCFSHNADMPCGLRWCASMDAIRAEVVYDFILRLCPLAEAREMEAVNV